MKEEKTKFPEVKYLYEHQGGEKYEVIMLVPKENESKYMFYDTINKKLITNSYFDSENGEDYRYESLKIDIIGQIIDSYETNEILKNGTMWDWKYYSTWVIDKDKREHCYKDPLTLEEKTDVKKWLPKFKSLYEKASYVFYSNSIYYLKIDNEWYKISTILENRPEDLKIKYPPKEDQDVRMIELEDLCPSFWSNPKTRDVSLIRELDYEVVDFEKGEGFNPINYSAGNYFFEVYMPGETITFKRYGAMGEHIKLYKIPTEYGGREDVLFIVLEPRNSDTKQASGMYVIRPRGIADEQQAE